jgi:hypothetical protein
MLITFVDLQSYFIKEKAEQLQLRDKDLSTFNKIIIGWTISLVSLNFLHSLAGLIYNSYFEYHSSLSDKPSYTFFRQFFSGLYVPFVDFCTATTLLYLFFYQGMQTLRKSNNQRTQNKLRNGEEITQSKRDKLLLDDMTNSILE